MEQFKASVRELGAQIVVLVALVSGCLVLGISAGLVMQLAAMMLPGLHATLR